MTLNEFITQRMKELGMNKSQLCDREGIAWSTLTAIKKGANITIPTKEKLARGLKCTIGEINACLAEEPNPLRKEAATREGTAGKQYEPKGVMETIDKLEKMVSEKPYVTPDLADEEPSEVFTEEPETDTDSMVLAVEEFWREIGKEFAKEVL